VHLAGLLTIWIASTIISVVAIVAGLIESRDFNRDRKPRD